MLSDEKRAPALKGFRKEQMRRNEKGGWGSRTQKHSRKLPEGCLKWKCLWGHPQFALAQVAEECSCMKVQGPGDIASQEPAR